MKPPQSSCSSYPRQIFPGLVFSARENSVLGIGSREKSLARAGSARYPSIGRLPAGPISMIGPIEGRTAEGLDAGWYARTNGSGLVRTVLIVDGFAMIQGDILRGKERACWWKPESQAKVASVVGSFRGMEAAEIWLVFEGPSGALTQGDESEAGRRTRVRIFHTPQADEWIIAQTRGEPPRFTVVTGDEELGERLAGLGISVMDPDAFLAGCRMPSDRVGGGKT